MRAAENVRREEAAPPSLPASLDPSFLPDGDGPAEVLAMCQQIAHQSWQGLPAAEWSAVVDTLRRALAADRRK
ncbi:MAG: hypothetical protein PVJ92_00170 [Candidatus Dependentiae bacterium]